MQTSKLLFQALIVALLLLLCTNVAIAAEQVQTKQGAQANNPQADTQGKERIYGNQLMTREERAEHRAKMHSLKTREEREAYRIEHHKKMQERAAKMGKTLPEIPASKGCGGNC